MDYILYPEDNRTGKLGGKAQALAALRRTGVAIPGWFVLSPDALYACLSDAERKSLATARDASAISPTSQKLMPSAEVQAALAQALRDLCPNGERVAVRSSAQDEDGSRYSFAGQHDSFLFVRAEDAANKVAAVWRSAFSERALAYRRDLGLSSIPHPPAVLIQRMVNAEVSGVAFGAEPVSGRRGVAIVTALYGLGTALVAGESDADTYHVDREGRILYRYIATKRLAHRCDPDSPDGIRGADISEEHAKRPALNDDQIRAVARLVRRAGRHFSRPQDIEWAIENGRLYLLQSRPITSLCQMGDPDGALSLWDNSNITESYGGITTPLTFSFARRAYEEVYRQFCRIMGVPRPTIAAHADTFRRMIGLIRGRVYYNLLSWYRVLAMLPGFSVNRRFMEQMMGVKEGLPQSVLAEIGPLTWRSRIRDSLKLFQTVVGLIVNHLFLPRRMKSFYRRLDFALRPAAVPLEELRADELAGYYHDLERQLLTRWDAPIINDFFAMVFFGVLRRLTERWCRDGAGSLHNELLCGDGGMISAEPVKRMREMAHIAVGNPHFVTLLCDGSLDVILEAMEAMAEFKERCRNYLERFGDRCLGELKLESPTLHDDPLPLLRSVGHLSRQMQSSNRKARSGIESELRRQAEKHAKEVLAARPLRRLLFTWVLQQARARVRDRENLRFERTRLFGKARRIFVEIGKRFYALDLLDSPRDIFYLEVDEILGFIEGTATTTDLRGLVALRKTEFAAYSDTPAPEDRFETRGAVHHGNPFRGIGKTGKVVEEDCFRGIGCSPGAVRGPVRVVTDPRNSALRRGEILVAERTDPGWIMLFPAAAGLLVERGSLLSHSAIVAREMGIPAVVSISGLTSWLKDGDWVEIDGGSGLVRRIEAHPEGTAHA